MKVPTVGNDVCLDHIADVGFFNGAKAACLVGGSGTRFVSQIMVLSDSAGAISDISSAICFQSTILDLTAVPAANPVCVVDPSS